MRARPDDARQCTETTAAEQQCSRWVTSESGLCPQHDPDHVPEKGQRCTALSTGGTTRPERKGKRCRRLAMKGQQVCPKHGGSSPQARKAAALRLQEEGARRAMTAYGQSFNTTATEALLNEVCRTAGHVEWLSQKVAELQEGELIWGTTRVKEGGQDGGTTQEAQAHMWLKLYREERAHLVRVCSEAIRCGIEERYVRLAEAHGQLVADALKAILGDLNLSPEQTKLAANVVPLRLRQLTA